MAEKDVAAKLGWHEAYSRRVRIITGVVGLILLFCGVICQWVASSRMSDVPLKLLCKTWAGEDAQNDVDDWNKYKYEYYNHRPHDHTLDLADVAAEFSGFNPGARIPLDQFLESRPSFWCRYLPECLPGTTCKNGRISWVNETWARGGAWVGRPISTEPHWNIAAGTMGFYGNPIRCGDKAKVFKDMLTAIHTTLSGEWTVDPATGAVWNEGAVEGAAREFNNACQRGKGSIGYILGCSPVLASLACVVCACVLFRKDRDSGSCCGSKGCCSPALGANLGQGLAIIAVAMTLIGFWVIAFQVSQEYSQSYGFCGSAPKNLVIKGIYFDGTACADVNTDAEKKTNPLLSFLAGITALYTAGGICNIIATVILLVAINKINESSKLLNFQNLEGRDDDDDDDL